MSQERRNPAFPRMISDYLRRRAAPVLPPRVVEVLREHLLNLLARGEPLPSRGKTIDWRSLAADCGLEEELLYSVREVLRPGLEAVRREIAKAPRPARSEGRRRWPPPDAKLVDPAPLTRRRGRRPSPVEEFPTPSTDAWVDPPDFADALRLHMRRHGDSPNLLARALAQKGLWIDKTAIGMWRRGLKAPAYKDSMAVLQGIERRYRLPAGYFRAKLPHAARATKGHRIAGIGSAERRRLAWHLPDDFDARSPAEQEEILEWVRRVIVSGATDYRRYQAAAMKQRFAIRFPELQGIRRDLPTEIDPDSDQAGPIRAPAELAEELRQLLEFKTSTLTPMGYRRRGVWGEETASQKVEHLGLMFGALAAAPRGPVRGRGLPPAQLTFGLLAFPHVWDWYLGWREARRGFYTAWERDMLSIAVALTAPDTGWLTQTPSLADRVQPIKGLVSDRELAAARTDWKATCAALHSFALARGKEIGRVARVHRDPFEPILPVLEAESPVGEYRKIADEILLRRPCRTRYPKAAAESSRALLMIRLGLHLGFRQKNLRQLLVCPRGAAPRSERILMDLKRGELRWSSRDDGWEVFVPASAFKNSGSSFFGGRPFRLLLPDIAGLYAEIEDYVVAHRRLLLGPAADPGTFFVKTVKRSSEEAAYNQTTFFEAWRWIIQRYGIFNPYTRRGAINGLLPHGPHNVRDVLATHILKQTGSYEQASYAIQDTPETVAQHYGRFLPQDKAAIAAEILNRAWTA
jgi:hypothetical protein